jgi:nucleoid DNA-binding protein
MKFLQFRKTRVDDYVKALATQHGMKETDVRRLLTWSIRNMCKMIENGEEIRIRGFGRIYFNKKKK